jgi:outer membrane lipoprotein SlyB
MKTLKMIGSSFLAVALLSGCAKSGVPELESSSTQYVLTSQSGVVTDAKAVVVKDSGGGGMLGAVVGGVLGSTMGGGKGSVLTALGGGLIGMYAGNEIAKSNAQELSVKLDDKQEVVVVSKGTTFTVGQRVKIVKRDGRIFNVEAAN